MITDKKALRYLCGRVGGKIIVFTNVKAAVHASCLYHGKHTLLQPNGYYLYRRCLYLQNWHAFCVQTILGIVSDVSELWSFVSVRKLGSFDHTTNDGYRKSFISIHAVCVFIRVLSSGCVTISKEITHQNFHVE